MVLRRAFVCALGLALFAPVSGETQETVQGLPETLRVLVAADENPEMFSLEESGPPGFERELLEGFCRIHGLGFEVIPVRDFDVIIPMLLRGEGDVITGIVDTAERRKRIAFTREVFPLRHVAVTRRPRGSVENLAALRGLRVGVIPGTSWESVVVAAGVAAESRVPFRDAEALLGGLRSDEADAVVMALLDYALARKRDGELVAGTFVGGPASAALGVHPDNATLLEALNAYLGATRQGRQHLMLKYLDESALSLIALARRD